MRKPHMAAPAALLSPTLMAPATATADAAGQPALADVPLANGIDRVLRPVDLP